MTDLETPQQAVELPTPNLPLLRKVLDHIDAHPEEWDQSEYGKVSRVSSCGTAFCIAGHALVMSGYETKESITYPGSLDFFTPDGVLTDPADEGMRVLGLTADEADDIGGLFSAGNTRWRVQRIAEQIAARAGEVL